MKKIPYGVNDFEIVMTDDYYYIDKTKYIELLENEGARYLVFLRPRRFGKTLFLDVLQKYYDIRYKDKFDILFKDLYISKNPTKNKNSYYVIKFDFSGVNTNSRDVRIIENNFNEKVKDTIEEFIDNYNLDFNLNLKENMPASQQLYKLIKKLKNKKHRLYVLIDEYDHFTNNVLAFDTSSFKDIVSKDGYFRAFFEVLKEGTNSVIDRIFITGVSPITLDSLTSGFNIALNKTLHPKYHDMLGFRQKEVDYLLNEIKIRCKFTDKQIAKLKKQLKFYYDGYLFSTKANNRLYNPDMLLYSLNEYIDSCQGPDKIIDTNIATDYLRLYSIINLLEDKKERYNLIYKLINNKEINSQLAFQFNFAMPIEDYHIISLFFYLGLLTIKGGQPDWITFTFSNYVIERLYYQYFIYLLNSQYKLKITRNKVSELIYNLAYKGDYKGLINYVSDILKGLSNRDYIRFTENYIKLIIITLLKVLERYIIISEHEVNGRYIDLMLIKREGFNVKYNYIFEFKYIKKENFSEQALAKKKKEGINQLKEYKELLQKEGYKIDKYILVIFCGYELKTLQEL